MLDVSITHSILIQINISCLTFVRISLKYLGALGARAIWKEHRRKSLKIKVKNEMQ